MLVLPTGEAQTLPGKWECRTRSLWSIRDNRQLFFLEGGIVGLGLSLLKITIRRQQLLCTVYRLKAVKRLKLEVITSFA